jgi:CHAT domain-containing protein
VRLISCALTRSSRSGRSRDSRRSLDAPLPKQAKDKPVVVPQGERPFAHPYYWAAFVLIGDPD